MSKDIIVLTPTGRRQKVHCTPDTSILQVLEDVCEKQGFQPTDYDLKHHNHILDLTTTIRFSNLPNKAILEMIEADKKRQETNVTVGLLMEDGERRTAEFPPNTSLYDLVTLLAPNEFNSIQHPTILYMRQEIIGEPALKQKTLRNLGLIGGRAILRLLNKAGEAKQANVSSVYRKESSNKNEIPAIPPSTSGVANINIPGPSDDKVHRSMDPVNLIKREALAAKNVAQEKESNKEMNNESFVASATEDRYKSEPLYTEKPLEPQTGSLSMPYSTTQATVQENLERRLRIEEEVTFLGTQKAIAFMQPVEAEEEMEDLPDDFYELTIDEVRKLYHDLQQNREEIENAPLITSSKKYDIQKQASDQKINVYKNVVVRIQFPDNIILQGVFAPTDTIEDVRSFVKEHLIAPDKAFQIFTTPLKEMLDSKMTLLEAKFVPCVHMHFKWLEGLSEPPYLKPEVYTKQTSSNAASILASKYRAPNRRKLDECDSSQPQAGTSTSTRNSKVPKWFKK